MSPGEQERFAVMISGIAETLGQAITKERISGLVLALDDVPWAHLQAALREAHKTARFIPTPGELRDLAKEAAKKPSDYYPELPEVRRDVRASWAGKDEEVRQMLASLPKPPESPGFADWFAGVAKRMHDMHAQEPTNAGAHGDPQGGQGQIPAQEVAPLPSGLRR